MVKYLIILFPLLSCSLFPSKSEKVVNLSSYEKYEQQDYVDHYKNFESFFLKNNQKKRLVLTSSTNSYLEQRVDAIINKNELFFTGTQKPKFYVIKSKTPFHFSLPGRRFFFSSSLVERYIKNETMLYCLLTFELIRSEKKIYPRKIIIPTGVLSLSRVLSLLRVDLAQKLEIHKWSFYILKRLGKDTDAYLSWLQLKNRNSLDFAIQVGDVQSISREESLFKAFLIKEVQNIKGQTSYQGSSRKFYDFLRNIKG